MTPEEHAEAKRLEHSARMLQENEIFQMLFSEMNRLLVEQMKETSPDDPRFLALGRHLHALGDVEAFIQGYIDTGEMSDHFIAEAKILN